MLKAIIDGLYLLREIVRGVKAITAFIEANKEEKWFQQAALTFTQIRNTANADLPPADKTQRYKNAGRAIRDLLGGV